MQLAGPNFLAGTSRFESESDLAFASCPSIIQELERRKRHGWHQVYGAANHRIIPTAVRFSPG